MTAEKAPPDAHLEKLMDELIAAHNVVGLDRKWHARQIAARQSLREYLSERTLTEEEARVLLKDITDDEGFVTLNDAEIEAWDSAIEKLHLISPPTPERPQ